MGARVKAWWSSLSPLGRWLWGAVVAVAIMAVLTYTTTGQVPLLGR